MSLPHALGISRHRAGPFLRAAAVVCALPVALTGCTSGGGSSRDDGVRGSGTQFVEGIGTITQVPMAKRKKAPEISGKTLEGKPIALSDFKDKVVVLNVWGSWCEPCREEAPDLAKVAKSTATRGVQFLGINTRDLNTAPPLAFQRRFKVTYPSLYDKSGQQVLKFKDSMSPQAIPSTLILDRQGRIAVRALAPLTEGTLRKALDPVIAES